MPTLQLLNVTCKVVKSHQNSRQNSVNCHHHHVLFIFMKLTKFNDVCCILALFLSTHYWKIRC